MLLFLGMLYYSIVILSEINPKQIFHCIAVQNLPCLLLILRDSKKEARYLGRESFIILISLDVLYIPNFPFCACLFWSLSCSSVHMLVSPTSDSSFVWIVNSSEQMQSDWTKPPNMEIIQVQMRLWFSGHPFATPTFDHTCFISQFFHHKV